MLHSLTEFTMREGSAERVQDVISALLTQNVEVMDVMHNAPNVTRKCTNLVAREIIHARPECIKHIGWSAHKGFMNKLSC